MRNNTIIVYGLGEMGASLALILNQREENTVIGVDIDEISVRTAQEAGIIDWGTTDLETVALQADVIILATPVNQIKVAIHVLAGLTLKESVIITDTGSTKTAILQQAEHDLTPKGVAFIGGHAMAGTHKTRVVAASALLYENAPYFLIPSTISANRVAKLKDLFEPLRANLRIMPVEKHDEIIAMVSDVPHITAFGLMNAASDQLGDAAYIGQFVAGGFIDTTRIAAADPELWTEIILSNKDAILASQQALITSLNQMKQAIEMNDDKTLYALFKKAQTARTRLLEQRG